MTNYYTSDCSSRPSLSLAYLSTTKKYFVNLQLAKIKTIFSQEILFTSCYSFLGEFNIITTKTTVVAKQYKHYQILLAIVTYFKTY